MGPRKRVRSWCTLAPTGECNASFLSNFFDHVVVVVVVVVKNVLIRVDVTLSQIHWRSTLHSLLCVAEL